MDKNVNSNHTNPQLNTTVEGIDYSVPKIIEGRGGYTKVFFAEKSLRPLCQIPDRSTAWAVQYFIAFTIRLLSQQGVRSPEVRKRVFDAAVKYNDRHLRGRVFKYTIRNAIKLTMKLQKEGRNTRPDDAEFESEGVISIRFPHTSNARVAMDGPMEL